MKKTKESIFENHAVLIFVIIGFQILYAGYKIIRAIGIILFDFELLLEPIMLLSLILYAIIIYLGISFFKMNPIGWYGVTSLYSFMFLKCTLIFLSAVFILFFGQTVFKNIKLPSFNINSKVIWEFIQLIVSGIMIKLLYSDDTLTGIEFKRFSKRAIIIKSIFLTIAVILIYTVICFLIVESYI